MRSSLTTCHLALWLVVDRIHVWSLERIPASYRIDDNWISCLSSNLHLCICREVHISHLISGLLVSSLTTLTSWSSNWKTNIDDPWKRGTYDSPVQIHSLSSSSSFLSIFPLSILHLQGIHLVVREGNKLISTEERILAPSNLHFK